MTFTKSILLGAAAAITGVVSAQAADLPSRKSAPVEYVRICDAYGAGFFFIPGTQTCLRIGGPRSRGLRYRSREGSVQRGINALGATRFGVELARQGRQHTLGWEARGRIGFDARTQTAWGTVQTTASAPHVPHHRRHRRSADARQRPCDRRRLDARERRSSASPASPSAPRATTSCSCRRSPTAPATGARSPTAPSRSPTRTCSAAASRRPSRCRIRPSTTSALRHGGGRTASRALGVPAARSDYVHNSMPQINGSPRTGSRAGVKSPCPACRRGRRSAVNGDSAQQRQPDTFDVDKNVWAVDAGAKINLPMLASGSTLYLTAAYANGMTEYTTNWTSFKTTAYVAKSAGSP